MFHLLVDISYHGFGHVSQTAAVVNALAQRVPGLRVTVRTTAPAALLAGRIHCDFRQLPVAFDFGMKMHNAVEVDVAASAVAYREFHADWAGRVEQAAQAMRALRPDLLLANVPYLSLAAARRAGVPAVGMCCLNWADIYQHYCLHDAASRGIHRQILDAYLDADAFLKVQPGMPMPDFPHALEIAPITRLGQSRRGEIAALLQLQPDERLVMVAMGGMEYRLPVQDWPRLPGIRWLLPQAWQAGLAGMHALESLPFSFTDVLASCDALITKPGYGTFAEAAYAGVPLLYVTRRDWPEEPFLVRWLQRHGVCLEVSREQLWQGEFAPLLQQLWARPGPQRPHADGAAQAADFIRDQYI